MQKKFSTLFTTERFDLIGIGTSVLCTIHCALLPLLVSSLPLAGYNLIENQWIELSMIVLAFAVGAFSFYSGCFKKHKNKKPLLVFIAGFSFLLLNQLQENIVLILAASALIIAAHLWNYRLGIMYNRCRLNSTEPLA